MTQALQVGLLHRVEVVDPHRTLAYASEMVQRQVFEPLYRRGDNRLVPQFFSGELEAVNGGYEAELRHGSKWSDGSSMSAAEICASLERCEQIPGDPTISCDGRRIRIETNTPLPALRELLAAPATGIVKVPANGDGEELIGSGPYRVEGRGDGERLTLVRNPHHAGPKAPIASIDFVAYANEAALGDAVARGQVDFTVALSPKELPAGSFVRTSYLPTPSTALLWMNVERLADSRLRRAISAAIDRRRLLALSYPGAQGLSAKGSLPVSLGQCADQVLHDPPLSRELLAEAGVMPADPLELALIWGPRPYLPHPLASTDELVRQLAEVGLRVKVTQTTDPVDYGRVMAQGSFDLALGGWYADDPSAWAYLSALYGSTSVPSQGITSGRSNFGRLRDPACDRALEQLRDDPLNPDRIDAVAAIVRELCPTVALHHGAATVALGRRIRGREFDSLGFPWFASFTMRR
jgi:peptide/nickel transport system substrate-binding protein